MTPTDEHSEDSVRKSTLVWVCVYGVLTMVALYFFSRAYEF